MMRIDRFIKKFARITLLVFVLVITLSFASFFQQPSQASEGLRTSRQQDNKVVVAVTHFSETLDPLHAWHYQTMYITQVAYETLVYTNQDGVLEGGLAKRWHISEDGLRYTFYLKDQTFHNGRKVTSEDVAYSFARHFWPGSKSSMQNRIRPLIKGADGTKLGEVPAGIQIIDPKTIVIELNKPYQPFLQAITSSGFSIVSRQHYRYGDPIGSGPFIPRLDKENKEWVLKRKTTKANKMNVMIVRWVPDFKSFVEQFKAELVDLVIGLPPGYDKNIKLPEDFATSEMLSFSFFHMFFDTREAVLANRDVRALIGQKLQEVIKKSKNTCSFFDLSLRLMSKGLMLPDYYTQKIAGPNKQREIAASILLAVSGSAAAINSGLMHSAAVFLS